ncbi:helix-turn-helix domain-containing protein [Sphingomonas carotinifaciens]|uniref:helix-turn-helix domain-containing protein n=1 Tax=Sphingomonas carotinifaciens TaxID=1166323 RepID=UPI0039A27E26
MKKALSVSEAKQALGLGRTSLYKLIKQERIASVRIGRRRLILVESIDALLGGSPAN